MTFRESDDRIVPQKLDDQSSGMKLGNTGQGKAVRPIRVQDSESPTLSGGSSVLDRLERITERAKSHPNEVFNNLFSLLNYELLWYAFRRLKRGKVPGVDGRTVEDYEEDLKSNLLNLLDRLHDGSYRPKPSLRVNISKGNGKKYRQKMVELRRWFRSQLDIPIGEMWQTLNAKLRGHYQYYGVNDNWPMLMAYRNRARVMVKRHLSRRSQRSYVNWAHLNRLCDRHPLANPRGLTDLIALSRTKWSAE